MIEQRFSTNKILRHFRKNQTYYYIPTYFRLNLKNIISLQFGNLSGKINCTLLISFNYKGIPNQLFQFLKNSVIVQFNKDKMIRLIPSLQTTIKDNPKDYILSFVVRKILTLAIHPDIFWSPFQIIQLILTATIQPIVIKDKRTGKISNLNFNMMDCNNQNMKLSHSDDNNYGFYTLAESKLTSVYNNKLQAQELRVTNQNAKGVDIAEDILNFAYEKLQVSQPLMKLQPFHYAHFTIPLFRHPATTLFVVFVPLWILSFLNLAVFFQDQILGKRFLNLAALMISYVALIPTIRNKIPPSKQITFIQLLSYLLSSMTLICLLQSIFQRNDEMIDQIYTKHWSERYFLLLAIGIFIFSIISVITLCCLHIFKWRPNYIRKFRGNKKQKFNHLNWSNEKCDAYFEEKLYKSYRKSLMDFE